MTIATSAVPDSGSDAGPTTRKRHLGWWARLRTVSSRKLVAGVVVLAVFALVAVVGPYVAPANPSATGPLQLHGPSGAHLLGTTETGQDVLSQLLVGTRVSLEVAVLAAVIGEAIAMGIGITAGYLGGLADTVLSALTNVVLVIPILPLEILLAAYLANRGPVVVALIIGVMTWPWGARILRAQTLSIRRRDYVEAARMAGEPTWRIVVSEILPNETAIITIGLLFHILFAILIQTSLAFLGLSSVSTWTWGTMLYWSQNANAYALGAWWWYVPPGLCIALVGMGLALVNLGVDEVVNPRLRTAGIGTRAALRAERRAVRASLKQLKRPTSSGVGGLV